MICTLCMSRKHRASRCPLKAAAALSQISASSDEGNWDTELNPVKREIGLTDLNCLYAGVRPDDTVDMGAGERNIRIEIDPMLRTPNADHQMLHIRGFR